MSAIPPKADILRVVAKGLLLTQSGHSMDYAVEPIGTEESGSSVNLKYIDLHMTFDGPHL